MEINFSYNKGQVMQALRYHFVSRPEIRLMIILVNVFALASIILYYLNYITAFAFLIGSLLWIVLMISFWFVLPMMVYRRSETFKHSFSMVFGENEFRLQHQNGGKSWPWKSLVYLTAGLFFWCPNLPCRILMKYRLYGTCFQTM